VVVIPFVMIRDMKERHGSPTLIIQMETKLATHSSTSESSSSKSSASDSESARSTDAESSSSKSSASDSESARSTDAVTISKHAALHLEAIDWSLDDLLFDGKLARMADS